MDYATPDGFQTDGGQAQSLAAAAEDADMLLRHAAQSGIDIPGDTVLGIIGIRQPGSSLAPETIGAFYAAYSKLSAKMLPVTVATLRVSEQSTHRVLRRQGIVAVLLAVAVVACSVVTFITAGISDEIGTGITHGNELAVRLRNRVEPTTSALVEQEICQRPSSPANPAISAADAAQLTGELQDFATTIRALLTSGIKLERLIPQREVSPLDSATPGSAWAMRPREMLQLHPELLDQRAEAFCKIYAYEDVRNFAKNVRADSIIIYGALAAYLLPVLYALLGASAYAMRDLSQRLQRRAYHPSSDAGNTARTIAAMTAGAIISLFGTLGQGLSLSPLAVAFLVGYGVEAFFAFLDSTLNLFRGNRRDAASGDIANR